MRGGMREGAEMGFCCEAPNSLPRPGLYMPRQVGCCKVGGAAMPLEQAVHTLFLTARLQLMNGGGFAILTERVSALGEP